MLNGHTPGIVCFTDSLQFSREALYQVARCRYFVSPLVREQVRRSTFKVNLQFFCLMSLLRSPVVVGVLICEYEGHVPRF